MRIPTIWNLLIHFVLGCFGKYLLSTRSCLWRTHGLCENESTSLPATQELMEPRESNVFTWVLTVGRRKWWRIRPEENGSWRALHVLLDKRLRWPHRKHYGCTDTLSSGGCLEVPHPRLRAIAKRGLRSERFWGVVITASWEILSRM